MTSTARAIYTVAELARAARISRRRMLRELEACGVATHLRGQRRIVYLGALRRGAPELWESLVYLHAPITKPQPR